MFLKYTWNPEVPNWTELLCERVMLNASIEAIWKTNIFVWFFENWLKCPRLTTRVTNADSLNEDSELVKFLASLQKRSLANIKMINGNLMTLTHTGVDDRSPFSRESVRIPSLRIFLGNHILVPPPISEDTRETWEHKSTKWGCQCYY